MMTDPRTTKTDDSTPPTPAKAPLPDDSPADRADGIGTQGAWVPQIDPQKEELKECYEFETALLDELRIFGALRSNAALRGDQEPDSHVNGIEVHYLARGHATWWLETDQREYHVHAGQTILILPGEVHSGLGGSLQPCELYWMRFVLPPPGESLPGFDLSQTALFRRGFESGIKKRVVDHYNQKSLASPSVGWASGGMGMVPELFQSLLLEHRNRSKHCNVEVARSLLHTLLAVLLRSHCYCESVGGETVPLSWRVNRAVAWLEAHYTDPDDAFDQLCRDLNCQKFNLKEQFKREMGCTTAEFVFEKRMRLACEVLRTTEWTVTEVAMHVGSSSSQYFATAFRRFTGMTPTEFRMRYATQRERLHADTGPLGKAFRGRGGAQFSRTFGK